MLVEQPANLRQNVAHLVGRSFVAQSQLGIEKDFVAAAEVLDVHGGQRAIGDGKLGSLGSANAGGAQTDVFHRAHAVAEAAHVSDADDFVAQKRNSAEKIFQSLLRGERDGDSADAQAGEGGVMLKPRVLRMTKMARMTIDGFQHALAQKHERAGARFVPRDGAFTNAPQQLLQNPPQQPVEANDESRPPICW